MNAAETYRAARLKHRGVVETLYTFALILLYMSVTPLTLMILFAWAALLFGWQVDDGASYTAMNNVIVLTLILGVLTVFVWIVAYMIAQHPPVPGTEHGSGLAPSHDTVTSPLQDQG